MKNRFFLKTRMQHNDFHIQLHGPFDGSSAFELINTLKNKDHLLKSVFINTSHVTRVFPFGRVVLDARLPKRELRKRIHFTGKFARDIVPEGCVLLKEKSGKKHKCTGTCKNCVCRNHPLQADGLPEPLLTESS